MSETIGKQLQNAREKRNLTISDVSKATRIMARHIEAIESDNFDSLPSPVQARAFLRIYAEYLDLSLDNLIVHQREDQVEKDNLIMFDQIAGDTGNSEIISPVEQENTLQGQESVFSSEPTTLISRSKQYFS